jgi:hypothetical protein
VLRTWVLIVSMVANVALLGLLLGKSAGALPSRVAAAASAPARQNAGDRRGGYGRLLALGLSDSEAKALLFANLESAALARIAEPHDRYWEPARGAVAEYALARAAAYAGVRAELEDLFGVAANSEPAFARAFRPLAPQFAFLSSAEQVALYESRLNQQAALAAAPPEPQFSAPWGPNAPPPVAARSPDGVLPAAAAREVELRDSARAAQLRASGAVFTEQEFRDTFALLLAADSAASTDARLMARRELRTILGAERFHIVSAGRDPVFPIVRRAVRERGLDEALIGRSYAILNDAQTRLLERGAARALDPERGRAAAQSVAAAEEQELIALVGEEVTRAIIGARAEFFAAASRSIAAGVPAPAQ